MLHVDVCGYSNGPNRPLLRRERGSLHERTYLKHVHFDRFVVTGLWRVALLPIHRESFYNFVIHEILMMSTALS